MKLRHILTIWICKCVFAVLRLRGSHGAALPGLIAEKLDPSLLQLLSKLPDGIIIISGTNGKTTTTRLLAEVLERSGKRVFTNHSGSNMTRGLLASIVRFATPLAELPFDVAVLEVDEAYAAKLSPILKPRASILTNVFRDQLDRFGEIDHTARLLGELAKNTTELVVFNSIDSRLTNIPELSSAKTVSYGVDQSLTMHFPDDDSLYAIASERITGSADYTLHSATTTELVVGHRADTRTLDRSLLPGWHNALNLISVYALAKELFGIDEATLYEKLLPPYGRGEVMSLNGGEFTLQLVKNPNGFRTAMDVLPDKPALIIINDLIADGRDVSWLWDVDVQPFSERSSTAVSGIRAYDMAVRLKYADIKTEFIEVDLRSAIEKFTRANDIGVLFLTYTAMLQSRKIIKDIQKGAQL